MLVVLMIVVFLGLVYWKRRSAQRKARQMIHFTSGRFARLAADRIEPPVELLNGIQKELNSQAIGVSSPTVDIHHEPGPTPLNRAWSAAGIGGALAEPMRNQVFYEQFQTWSELNSLDPKVFEGFSALSKTPVENLADLRSVISERDYSIDTTGFVSKLKGHAAEMHVHERLIEAGHDVAMPLDPNQPGFDLIVDGQEFNVKLYKDAADAIAKHAARYPEVGVIVPGDAINIPENALHFYPGEMLDISSAADGEFITIVDHALSHLDVDSSTRSVLTMAQDEGINLLEDGTLDFEGLDFIDGVPLITIAISSFREAKLLMNNDTDIYNATKNVAIDAVGVGAGALAGAKLGGSVGSIVPGPGTLIGAAIGGMAGALAGRMAGNSIKQAPLRKAHEVYEGEKQLYLEREAHYQRYAEEAWSTAFSNEQAQLRSVARQINSEYKDAIRDLRNIVNRASYISKNDALQVFEELRAVCIDRLAQLAADFNQMSAFQRTKGYCGYGEEAQIYFRYRSDVHRWETEVDYLLDTWVDGPESTEIFFDLVLGVTDDEHMPIQFIDNVQNMRATAVANVDKHYTSLVGKLFAERKKSEARLIELMDGIRAHVEKHLKEHITAITRAKDAVQVELARLGKA